MLAHKGSREGVDVAETHRRAAARTRSATTTCPSVTYCHPEVASIGLTEEQCKEKKLDYQVGRFPLSANGRARASNETEGFVKIIRDKKYGEILGAHIVASHASEMIHELVVARENEYTVEEVDLAIHAHPDAVGGDRRGGARLDGAGPAYVTLTNVGGEPVDPARDRPGLVRSDPPWRHARGNVERGARALAACAC